MCTPQASYDKKQLDVGANLFIGNLDPNVDERVLYDTFSAFGIVSQTAKVCPDLPDPKSRPALVRSTSTALPGAS